MIDEEWYKIGANLIELHDDKLSATDSDHYDWSQSSKVSWKIKWNAKSISNGGSGYVLQHMKIVSEIDEKSNADYYEAWKVIEGCVAKTEPTSCDVWDCGFLDTADEYDRQEVIHSKSGKVTYEADVYWIPIGTDAYSEIDEWKPYGAWQAEKLKSSKKK